MEPCALWQVCACSAFRNKMGCSSRHCLSTFNFQMALTRKTVLLDTHTFSLPLSFSTSSPFQHISHGSFQHMDRVSGPECAAWGDGEAGETARKAEWDLRGSCGKSGGSLSVALCVCSLSWSVWTDCVRSGWYFRHCVICLHLLNRITNHTNIFKTPDTFPVFLRSLNHKNLILGNSPLASSPMAVGIDRRSIPPAGDNHSVSASTDPNSYLSLLTASMAQLTTGTHIFSYCSKAPAGHLGGNVF